MPTEEDSIHFGSFELLELLGEGAMARVYRARQTGPMGFSKEVALKRLRKGAVGRDRREIEALVNEARLGGKLRHPNLVEVYGCEVVDGSFCLAMEFVNGWELDDVLWQLNCADVRLPKEAVIDILRQLADGIDYAHAATDETGNPLRLVHRDLKPQNIFLDRRGVVKIADFGLAKSTANLYQTTESDVTRGSPLYMSPEQIEGKPLDGRSDLFAMGSIASELSTSVRPFEGNSIPNTLVKILSADYGDALHVLDRQFPALTPIVRRLFEQDRAHRYPNGRSLLQDLERLSDGRAAGVHTRGLALALSGSEIGGLPPEVRAIYLPIADALSGRRGSTPPLSGTPAPRHDSERPPSFVSEPAPATPPASPRPAPHYDPLRTRQPVEARPTPPPRQARPPVPSRPPPPRAYEQANPGPPRPNTPRGTNKQAVRSILIVVFALAVSVYFFGLYFEVFAPPTVVLQTRPEFEELPPGPLPAVDSSGQLIHFPPGITRGGQDANLSARTVIGNWEVTCVYRPLEGARWSRSPMTASGKGRHDATIPLSAFAEGAIEYYFEAVKLATGERVFSGRPEAPFRIQNR